jgi:hypothetical protein
LNFYLNFSIKNRISLSDSFSERLKSFSDHDLKISFLVFRHLTGKPLEAGKDISTSIHFLEQNFATFHLCFMMVRDDPKNKVLNRKITQLIEGGIIQKLENDRIEAIGKKIRERSSLIHSPKVSYQGLQVLTLEHLGLSFFAVLICLAFSTVVFALECVAGFVFKRLEYSLNFYRVRSLPVF